MGVFEGVVVSLADNNNGGRIKVRIKNIDKSLSDTNLPYAFPLIPKIINIKPKIGETVIILTNDEDGRKQRFFVGPVISQMQNMYLDYDSVTSTSMLNGGKGVKLTALDNFIDSIGCVPEDDEIGIVGRKNTDIILSDNDIRIRCGCKILKPNAYKDGEILRFNKMNPSFIKLNYYEQPLRGINNEYIYGSINIVSDYINILSGEGSPNFEGLTDRNNKQISDETLKEIIDKAHPLPYGDDLVEFLKTFVNAFNTHTHNANRRPPVPSLSYNLLQTETNHLNNILSKHIRIN